MHSRTRNSSGWRQHGTGIALCPSLMAAVGFGLLTSFASAAAVPEGGDRPEVIVSDPKPFEDTIGVGDTLDIRVFGDESSGVLSGQFVVRHDGKISYPVLGEFPVAGMTAARISEAMALSLKENLSILGMISVSVAQYAPVFIVGDAASTGAKPFEPGMTALRLVLLSGGLPTLAEKDLISTRGSIAEHEATIASLKIQKARLVAELERKELAAESLEGLADQHPNLFSYESQVQQTRAQVQKATLAGFEAQRSRAQQEVKSLKQSIALHDEEVKLAEEQVATQDRLAQKGLTAQSKVSDLQQELSRARIAGLEFRTELFRAEQSVITMTQQIDNLGIERDADNLAKLSDIETQLAQTYAKLGASRNLISRLLDSDDQAKDGPEGSWGYTIYRNAGNGYQKIPKVRGSTLLVRGDVLQVTVTPAQMEKGDDVRSGLTPEGLR